ncbi:MAG: cysteine--tRNA ligase [Phycisphaerales bacterium]|nr:MAG: cysteine--tRNA ligase [Phycisphaerales bacterium]
MKLRIYNTLTNREEEFVPLDPAGKKVTFYSCGPTVYDYAHIGNFRSFLVADVLRRTLELIGYEVKHVMNITDVGHMTDDEIADGGGEDKMEVAAQRVAEAKKSGKLPSDVEIDPTDPYAIADFYADEFLRDARMLGLKVAIEQAEHPELMPRPTRFIEPMVGLVKALIDKGHAYVADDGAVYFDVQSFPDYGQLSGNTPDSIRSGEGGRIDEANQAFKKHPADFLLWKPDPSHIMKWPTPWGEGYPGWHLECSVMAQSLLGADTNGMIDLHSGGEDNLFPHHECELAQARGFSGADYFARYWFHGRHLMVEGDRMSKSKGNFFTLQDMLDKGASPAALRLELIKTHYRSNANFTFQGLKDSQRQVDRWAKLQDWLSEHRNVALDGPGPLSEALLAFKQALCDDLNIARAIGVLNEAASQIRTDAAPAAGTGSTTYADELDALNAMNSVLGVLDLQREAGSADKDEAAIIEAKIAQRTEARAAKDWAAADAIRDELLAMGIAIKDGPEGTTWTRMVK